MFCSSDFCSKKGGGGGSERLLRAFSNLVLETSKNKHCTDSFTDLFYCSTVLMLKTLIFLSYKLYMLHILHLCLKLDLKFLRRIFFLKCFFKRFTSKRTTYFISRSLLSLPNFSSLQYKQNTQS